MDPKDLHQQIVQELLARGIPQEKINMDGVGQLAIGITNAGNEARLAGKLQPGQAEHVAALKAAGAPSAEEYTLGGGAKASAGALMDMLKGTAGMAGKALHGMYTGNVPELGQVGKEAAMGAINAPQQFVGGLAKEIRSPATTTPQDVAQTVAGGVGTLGDIGLLKGGMGAAGIGPAARAAQLAKDLKFSEGALAGRAAETADPMNQATFIRRGGTPINGPGGMAQPAPVPPPGPGTMGIAPKFEEDVMPRAMEPTPASPYPAAGGYSPELQQLFKEVLEPAKEEAPQEGAGFQALKQTRRAKARLGKYRQSEDDTGGQPS